MSFSRRDFLKSVGVAGGALALNACTPGHGKEGEPTLAPTEALSNVPSITDAEPFVAFPGETITITGENFLTAKTDVTKLAVVLSGESGGASLLARGTDANIDWEQEQVRFQIPTNAVSQHGDLIVINGDAKISNKFPIEIVNPENSSNTAQLFIRSRIKSDGEIAVVIKSANIPAIQTGRCLWTTVAKSTAPDIIYYVAGTTHDDKSRTSTVIKNEAESLRLGDKLPLVRGESYLVSFYDGAFTDGDPQKDFNGPAIIQETFVIN